MVDLDAFVDDCKSALASDDPVAAVEGLVRDVIADPEALHSAFGERITGKSLRDRIIFHDDELTVVQIATVPGLQSPVHNHNMWAVIGVYDGEEHNAFFEETDGTLKQTGERLLKSGDVAVLAPKTIHAIDNPIERKSNAIHVYGGNLVARTGRSMWNPRTQEREDYEIGQLSEYTKELSGIA
ncbi:MAG: hypothetical protein GKS00_10950 [Alphaproteobacteria bacterium]|nr:hypothetical protein [Alphaproteobacteria bacterium]